MTFEDMENRAPAPAMEGASAPARPRRPLPPRRDTAADEMLRFVDKGALVADQLRGLRVLFLGSFDVANGAEIPAELAPAVDILAECMASMADRLDLIAREAREARDHLGREAAR